MESDESADQELALAKSLWASGDLQALQIHFCEGGASGLWHLIYPGRALEALRSPAGRARVTQAIEEALENTRFEISEIPTKAQEKGPKMAGCSLSAWEGSGAWGKVFMSYSGRALAADEIDKALGARSLRVRGASLLEFCSMDELVEKARSGARDPSWLTVGEVCAEALALKERRELLGSVDPAAARAGPKL